MRVIVRLRADHVGQALAAVALGPAGSSGSMPRTARERVGEERERREGCRGSRGPRVAAAAIGRWSAPSIVGSDGDLDDPGAPLAAVPGDVDDGLAARAGRGQGDDGRRRADQRRGARRHLPRLRALGVDEGHLLELERSLEGSDVAAAAADDEDVLGGREVGGQDRRPSARPRRSRDSAASAAARGRVAIASARSSPNSSPTSRIAAVSVEANVLVMTGTELGPPADMITWSARPVSVEPGLWTIATVGTRPRSDSVTARTSRNSPDALMPTTASPGPSAGW